MSSTTTSSAPSATNTGQGNGSGSSNSSPLLFFVALGFGVVFTNLWIIVGVKYCFRYNQRNRAMRAQADGDPIDLTAMPRPHRRRREKKLMSMDDVNSRFPLIKYKAWRASREEEGLPAAGGITAPPSRAASIIGVDSIDVASVEQVEADSKVISSASVTSAPGTENTAPTSTETTDFAQQDHITPKPPQTDALPDEKRPDHSLDASVKEVGSEDDEDEDDPISNAAPPELLTQPGDTCAICLDTLEDDDDVRGLTCGHAFHAACVDPWLTGRRACCPLCKADYYVPKPRPEGEQSSDSQTNGRRTAGVGGLRLNLPQSPQNIWLGGRYISSRSRASRAANSEQIQYGLPGRQRSTAQAGASEANSAPRSGSLFNMFRRSRREPAASADPTPGNLEAGVVR